MTGNGTLLMAYVSDIRNWLGDSSIATLTEIPTECVMRLYGGDIGLLTGPGLGVALMVPQPTVEQRMVEGENALHRWQVVITCKAPAMPTAEESLMYALDVLSIIRVRLSLPGNPFPELEAATPLYEIYDTDPTTTIAALNYDLNWPL